MKLYSKVKVAGKWSWRIAETPLQQFRNKKICECRTCNPDSILKTGEA